ncbi:MAG: iron-containing alcohol dehydrogenase [Phycisphaerales bacterium]
MNLQSLLGSSFECRCGSKHVVGVREFRYHQDVIGTLPEIIRAVLPGQTNKKVTVVSDIRTNKICGRRVYESLSVGGFDVAEIIVPDTDGRSPICDDVTCGKLKEKIVSVSPDITVAVGSGTINDLCKWSSFELGLPYIVIATAASMNGYAAMNVAAKINGVKVVMEAKPPLAVLAEPQVIENAPFEMTAAGFGDTVAKSQSNADWLMNNYLFSENFCDYCVEVLSSLEAFYLNKPQDIKNTKSDAVKGLFEALFWTGIVMTMVGSSAPASGGEHLLSHTLDMIADMRGQKHNLHGAQVALGTIISAALYEELLKIDRPTFRDMPEEINYKLWSDSAVAESVVKQYKAKKQQLDIVRSKLSQQGEWERLKIKLRAIVRNPQKIRDCLKEAGAACTISDLNLSREQITEIVSHMHEIRKRFTVVDLAWLTGILPSKTDEIIDKWLSD